MKQAAIRKFSAIRSPPLAPNESGATKKSVPGPASPLHVFNLLLFTTFRKPIFVDTNTKAGIYLCIAAGGSLLFDFVRAPPSYFSNKYNLLNQAFVKWGWGWTCIMLSTFVIFSSFIYTASNVKLMRAHILRIVIGTGCWYSVTGFLSFVHDLTGHCQPTNLTLNNEVRPMRRTLCHKAGGVWIGFDISGHCFLLVLANLWIMEELQCMQHWPRLAGLLKPFDQHSEAEVVPGSVARYGVTADQWKTARSAFRRLTGAVRAIFTFTACLSMIWDFMFLMTIIYFHTMPSKLFGTVIAVACWFVCYRVVFPCAKTGDWFGIAPGMPGDSPFEFVANRK
ncbi:Fat inducing protein 1 [Fasciola hepatica]|uniref:Fat inducing protein 1 n=1 Tax=Fasciola hepatica TaxID=6192 RepID=A0A4E0S0A9_FASHE|nr:Fat inducing protein 1 [Fasciola hepatica]